MERPYSTSAKSEKEPLNFSSFKGGSLIREYLDKATKNRPLIVGVPENVKIKFTDPLNPGSPHAVFRVIFENQGNKPAMNIKIDWKIMDNGSLIVSPNEWFKIVTGSERKPINNIDSGFGFVYVYGPEIGAYARTKTPKIELTLTVSYEDNDNNKYTYYCRSKTIDGIMSEEKKYLFEILEIK